MSSAVMLAYIAQERAARGTGVDDKPMEKPKAGLFKRWLGFGIEEAPSPVAPEPPPVAKEVVAPPPAVETTLEPPPPEASPLAPAEPEEAKPAARSGLGRWFGGGEPAPATLEAAPEAPKRSWLSRLTSGLTRSSSALGRGIADIFTKRKLDATSLDDLEDILLQADLGIGPATRIRDAIGKGRYEKGIDPEEVRR